MWFGQAEREVELIECNDECDTECEPLRDTRGHEQHESLPLEDEYEEADQTRQNGQVREGISVLAELRHILRQNTCNIMIHLLVLFGGKATAVPKL